ncbi:MAG: hypothetical protein HDR50_09895 [Desulfovibrio sp.]|uniref:hypothetical protein n=1 Tax=Desulfovibrio sp. TaxID=885 RepID=UPI001A693D7B|nr:hypothetical protein [Desulfovibrio sp.]MBD5417940.1 hypothetical protein [Desulfovibrio sp.]
MNLLAKPQANSLSVSHSSLTFILPALAILVPSILTAFKQAQFIHSDIILFQIMSLHNPTLFYWGQNRLLNVIPFLLQFITSPKLNMFFVAFSCAASFFVLLWVISCVSQRIISGGSNKMITFIIYTFNFLICICLFVRGCWNETTLSHPEYSLALNFGILAVYFFYYFPHKYSIFALVCGFIAIGINPSVILLFAFFMFFKCLYMHKISRGDAFLSILMTIFFLVWLAISMQYGIVETYYDLDFSMILQGIKSFFTQFIMRYFFSYSLCFIGILFFIFMIVVITSTKLTTAQRKKIIYISLTTLVSIFIYALIISSVPHFHANLCASRYFIFVVFMIIFIMSINFTAYIAYFINIPNKLFMLFLFIFCCVLPFRFPNDFNIRHANVYKSCDEIIPSGTHVYAGDYWKIWSCMSRDLIDGYDSRSLGFRSISDKQNIQKKLRSSSHSGVLDISCLNAEIEMCKSQIGDFYSKYNIKEIQQINPQHINLVIDDLVENL